MKYRHELKHQLTYGDYISLKKRLDIVCPRDKNATEGYYIIRSLYYDNADDKALFEKLDGVNRREKFRIRYYNGDTSFIHLEKKAKHNQLCLKNSEKITVEEVQKLLDNDIDFLRQEEKPLFTEFYSKIVTQRLTPKTIVEYKREPFTYPAGNVRITFDSKITTGMTSLDFLNPNSPMMSTGNTILLEVKYDEFIPDFLLSALQTKGHSAAAFSKYAAARMYV